MSRAVAWVASLVLAASGCSSGSAEDVGAANEHLETPSGGGSTCVSISSTVKVQGIAFSESGPCHGQEGPMMVAVEAAGQRVEVRSNPETPYPNVDMNTLVQKLDALIHGGHGLSQKQVTILLSIPLSFDDVAAAETDEDRAAARGEALEKLVDLVMITP